MRIKPIISSYCFDCEEVREHSFEGYSNRYKTFEYCCMHCAESVYYSRKSLKRSYNRRKRDNYFTRKGIIHKTSLINRLRYLRYRWSISRLLNKICFVLYKLKLYKI